MSELLQREEVPEMELLITVLGTALPVLLGVAWRNACKKWVLYVGILAGLYYGFDLLHFVPGMPSDVFYTFANSGGVAFYGLIVASVLYFCLAKASPRVRQAVATGAGFVVTLGTLYVLGTNEVDPSGVFNGILRMADFGRGVVGIFCGLVWGSYCLAALFRKA